MTATALTWPIPNVLLSNGCDADSFLRKSGYDTLHAAVRVIDTPAGHFAVVFQYLSKRSEEASDWIWDKLSNETLAVLLLIAQAAQRALLLDFERVANLVDRLLAVARLQSEPLAFDKRYELGRGVRDTLATMAPLTLKQEKELALPAPDEPDFIRGNPVALDEMRHPIDNALRFTPAGGIVEVTVSREATIALRDRGPGISTEAAAAHIFEPFWRRDGADNGSVLGLAIARETAKRHGGRLVAANALDGGAVFRLEIPRTP